MASVVMDLPQPDSPTRPMVSAGADVKVDVVDDVDVTVMPELNAEVTDRENRFDTRRAMAVVTLELDIAQGARRAERDWACSL